MLYIVSYDLNDPGQDYPKLITELEKLGAKRILFSQWGVRKTNTTAAKLRDHLSKFIDSNDRLLVISAESGSWASKRLMTKLSAL